MGSCTSQGKNADLVGRAKSILAKEGYDVEEVRDGKIKGGQIPNKVALVRNKGQRFAFKIRYFDSALDSQGLSAQVGVLSELQHPNFVRVYQCFVRNHLFFFRMDYYPTTLRQILRKNEEKQLELQKTNSKGEQSQQEKQGKQTKDSPEVNNSSQSQQNHQLSRSRRFRYAKELVEGVHLVHSAGHTHRELKAQNIMVSENDNLVVAEFGLEFDSNMRKKRQETSVDSDKWYLAPEINQNTESIYYQQTRQTDIYVVGLLIAEIFGWRYASVEQQTTRLAEIIETLKTPENIADCFKDIDEDIKQLILPMLHPNPDKRGELDQYLPFFNKNQQ